jgi:hypothetical protein
MRSFFVTAKSAKLQPSADDKYAIFPADNMPAPDATGPVPVDRAAGIKRCAEAEKPPRR